MELQLGEFVAARNHVAPKLRDVSGLRVIFYRNAIGTQRFHAASAFLDDLHPSLGAVCREAFAISIARVRRQLFHEQFLRTAELVQHASAEDLILHYDDLGGPFPAVILIDNREQCIVQGLGETALFEAERRHRRFCVIDGRNL
jgi:hypothetical protein